MNVYILTEGGQKYGFGHISRCVALTEALQDISNNITIKFIIDADNSVMNFFSGIENVQLKKWQTIPEEITELFSNEDIIIIDSYIAPKSFYNSIARTGCLCVYIDDYNRIDYPKGIVVNATVNAETIPYKRTFGSKYLLGVEFAYLRKEFRTNIKRKVNKDIKNIIISFGGNDFRNLFIPVIDSLKKHKFSKTILITDAMKDKEVLLQLSKDDINIIQNADASQIKNEMLKADLGIVAAGQIIFEAVRTGLPCISIQVAKNQELNVKFWTQNGILTHAGNYDDDKLFDNIDKSLQSLCDYKTRKEISDKSYEICDGMGVVRIAHSIITEQRNRHINLRTAKFSDIDILFTLANLNSVRKNSFNSELINRSEHEKWLENILNNENEVLLIAEFGKEFIGQVRFTKTGNHATVGISIIESYHGQGYGKIILKKGIEYVSQYHKPITEIHAYVKENNSASAKLFKSLGFNEIERVEIKSQFANKYILNQ